MGADRRTVSDVASAISCCSGSGNRWSFIVASICCICACVAGQGRVDGNSPSTETQDFLKVAQSKTDTDQTSAKLMLLKIILAKASNEVSNEIGRPKDTAISPSRAGLGRIDEVGRFFRGAAPMGSDYLNRYFLYRYDMGDRWTMARIDPPVHSTTGAASPPATLAFSAISTTNRPNSAAAQSPSTIGSETLRPLFSMASMGPPSDTGTTKIWSSLPASRPAVSSPAPTGAAVALANRCREIPQRFAVVICRNETTTPATQKGLLKADVTELEEKVQAAPDPLDVVPTPAY